MAWLKKYSMCSVKTLWCIQTKQSWGRPRPSARLLHPNQTCLSIIIITKYVVKDTLYGALVQEPVHVEPVIPQHEEPEQGMDGVLPISPQSTITEQTEEAPETPQSINVITGLGVEDKLCGKAGEPQVVAAMIVEAAYLGREAINAGKSKHIWLCQSDRHIE